MDAKQVLERIAELHYENCIYVISTKDKKTKGELNIIQFYGSYEDPTGRTHQVKSGNIALLCSDILGHPKIIYTKDIEDIQTKPLSKRWIN